MAKTVKKIVVVRDPSKEPYPSPYSDEQRTTLSHEEHLQEMRRASAKEALARHQAEYGLEGPFADADESATSAGATVGLSLRSVSDALRLFQGRKRGAYDEHTIFVLDW